MNPSYYQNVKSLIYGVPENAAFDSLKGCCKKFIVNVLNLFADVKGRINLRQMSRFSGQCEQYFSIAVFCRENEAEICRKMYFPPTSHKKVNSWYPTTAHAFRLSFFTANSFFEVL